MIRLWHAWLFVFTYSLSSPLLKYVNPQTPRDELILVGVFSVCAAASALYMSHRRGQLHFERKNYFEFFVIAIAGIFASFYFWSITFFGAAAAEWLEKAITPFLIGILGVLFLKSYPSKREVLGFVIGFFGFCLVLWELHKAVALPVEEGTQVFMQLQPSWMTAIGATAAFLGALGSSIALIWIRRLINQGVDRYVGVIMRYGPVGIISLLLGAPMNQALTLTFTDYLIAVLIGVVFFNVIYFCSMNILARAGAVALAVCFLIIPIATSIWELVFPPHHPRSLGFYIAAGIVTIGAAMVELPTKSKSPS